MRFPLEKLPARARDAIESQAALGNYPVEGVGSAALAVMSHAAQGLYNVDSLQRPGVTYPLSQLFMVLSQSGDAKSSIFSRLMTGVGRFQRDAGLLHEANMAAYQVDMRAWEKERIALDKDKDATRDSRVAHENSKPSLPRSPFNTHSKITTNGIYQKLQTGLPTFGLFTGEGGSMLAGHSLRKENSPAEFASAITTLWDGEAIDRTTGDVTMLLRGRRLSGLIMVQSEVAAGFLNDPVLKVHGIHARFCIVTTPGWEMLDTDFTDPAVRLKQERLVERLSAFNDRIEELLNEVLPVSQYDDRELTPPTIGWSAAAAQHMRQFQTRAIEMRREEETFFKRTFEHACRMAGVLAVFEGRHKAAPRLMPFDQGNPVTLEIGLAEAEAATALVEFYAEQWRKLDVACGDERDSRLAGYIARVQKFMSGKASVTARDISRAPMKGIDLKVRHQVIDSMKSDGLIVEEEAVSGTNKITIYRLAA
ncbi:DUF3987 domain-containing protein [Sphingobium sp. H39-3-25]|uniref:DUF3987 domain-containing protein n=1 Tax=Sphingobium arseniciresistens TaxID=3030834 RepID=UPI0023B8952E|nr:DUF3987 domain-containing protein [Sphingobium arseniciresistens]